MLDLAKFCSTYKYRPYLNRPFSFGPYTYATNGHIIIRVDRRDDAPEGALPMTENGIKRAMRFGEDSEFQPLRACRLPAQGYDDCLSCSGRGTVHDCSDCECECPNCDGTGRADEKRSIIVCGVIFDVKYIEMLLELPSIEVEVSPPPDAGCAFRFDGGVGTLMPLRCEYPSHIGDINDFPLLSSLTKSDAAE